MTARLGDLRELTLIDKPNDESVNSDTTLNDDSDLVYPLIANEDLHFEFWAYFTADLGGIKVAVNGPAAFTHLHYSVNLDIAGATKVSSAIATAYDTALTNAGAASGMIRIIGHVHNGANAGNLVLRWAQNASNVNNTTIHQGSSLKVIRY